MNRRDRQAIALGAVFLAVGATVGAVRGTLPGQHRTVRTVTVTPAACTEALQDADTIAADITRVIHVGKVKIRTFNELLHQYQTDSTACGRTK